ncbi:MAG: hypothetical protein LBI79_02730 [Nitrososphaerota archaeon]|nr:hypothetical protein [Nitrososphaerota archaeon]
MNMKLFSVALVVLCFTAGVTGAYLVCYFAQNPPTNTASAADTDNTMPVPETNNNYTQENQQNTQNIVTEPTPTPEKTVTMYVYEFYIKEAIICNEIQIINSLKDLGNYYCYTDWFSPVTPDGSKCDLGIQIGFYQKAIQEQIAIIQQSSIESYGIKCYAVEVPQYVVEAYEVVKVALEKYPLVGYSGNAPVSYGTGIPDPLFWS